MMLDNTVGRGLAPAEVNRIWGVFVEWKPFKPEPSGGGKPPPYGKYHFPYDSYIAKHQFVINPNSLKEALA